MLCRKEDPPLYNLKLPCPSFPLERDFSRLQSSFFKTATLRTGQPSLVMTKLAKGGEEKRSWYRSSPFCTWGRVTLLGGTENSQCLHYTPFFWLVFRALLARNSSQWKRGALKTSRTILTFKIPNTSHYHTTCITYQFRSLKRFFALSKWVRSSKSSNSQAGDSPPNTWERHWRQQSSQVPSVPQLQQLLSSFRPCALQLLPCNPPVLSLRGTQQPLVKRLLRSILFHSWHRQRDTACLLEQNTSAPNARSTQDWTRLVAGWHPR